MVGQEAEQRRLFIKYLPKFVDNLDPGEIIPHLPCLPILAREEIEAKQEQKGRSTAVQTFYENLIRRDNWHQQFLEALRQTGQKKLANYIDPTKRKKYKDGQRGHQTRRSRASGSPQKSISVEQVHAWDINEQVQVTVSLVPGADSEPGQEQRIPERSHKIDKTTPFRKLPYKCVEILMKLDHTGTINKWERFAESLGYTMVEDIDRFQFYSSSPTKAVLNEWKTQHEATLGRLTEALQQIERPDILTDLEEELGVTLVENEEPETELHSRCGSVTDNKQHGNDNQILQEPLARSRPTEEKRDINHVRNHETAVIREPSIQKEPSQTLVLQEGLGSEVKTDNLVFADKVDPSCAESSELNLQTDVDLSALCSSKLDSSSSAVQMKLDSSNFRSMIPAELKCPALPGGKLKRDSGLCSSDSFENMDCLSQENVEPLSRGHCCTIPADSEERSAENFVQGGSLNTSCDKNRSCPVVVKEARDGDHFTNTSGNMGGPSQDVAGALLCDVFSTKIPDGKENSCKSELVEIMENLPRILHEPSMSTTELIQATSDTSRDKTCSCPPITVCQDKSHLSSSKSSEGLDGPSEGGDSCQDVAGQLPCGLFSIMIRDDNIDSSRKEIVKSMGNFPTAVEETDVPTAELVKDDLYNTSSKTNGPSPNVCQDKSHLYSNSRPENIDGPLQDMAGLIPCGLFSSETPSGTSEDEEDVDEMMATLDTTQGKNSSSTKESRKAGCTQRHCLPNWELLSDQSPASTCLPKQEFLSDEKVILVERKFIPVQGYLPNHHMVPNLGDLLARSCASSLNGSLNNNFSIKKIPVPVPLAMDSSSQICAKDQTDSMGFFELNPNSMLSCNSRNVSIQLDGKEKKKCLSQRPLEESVLPVKLVHPIDYQIRAPKGMEEDVPVNVIDVVSATAGDDKDIDNNENDVKQGATSQIQVQQSGISKGMEVVDSGPVATEDTKVIDNKENDTHEASASQIEVRQMPGRVVSNENVNWKDSREKNTRSKSLVFGGSHEANESVKKELSSSDSGICTGANRWKMVTAVAGSVALFTSLYMKFK